MTFVSVIFGITTFLARPAQSLSTLPPCGGDDHYTSCSLVNQIKLIWLGNLCFNLSGGFKRSADRLSAPLALFLSDGSGLKTPSFRPPSCDPGIPSRYKPHPHLLGPPLSDIALLF